MKRHWKILGTCVLVALVTAVLVFGSIGNDSDLQAAPHLAKVGQNVTLRVTISSFLWGPAKDVQVTFHTQGYGGMASLCSSTTDGQGVATCQWAPPMSGEYVITVTPDTTESQVTVEVIS
jgi:hypothetical protein